MGGLNRPLSRRSLMVGGAGGLMGASLARASPRTRGQPSDASLELSWSDSQLSGPGAERLLAAALLAQFVIVVESHNDHVTPLITAYLFRRLAAAGFDHLAVEQDPWGMEIAGSTELRGDLSAIAAAANRYPYNFTFTTDEELGLLADVGRLSSAREPIWGLDQLFGATGPLEEIRRLESQGDATFPLAGLLSAAALMERRRGPDGRRNLGDDHFMALRSDRVIRQLGALGDHRAKLGGRAGEWLRRLELSAKIYAANRQPGAVGSEGLPMGLIGNQLRETLMKESFLAKYSAASGGRASHPRVLVKAGYWHAVRGKGPGSVFTLGSFLHEFAIAQGGSALAVQIVPLREWWPDHESVDPHYRVLLPEDAMERSTLVDLRPVRGRLYEGATFGLAGASLTALTTMAFGLDYLLFTPSEPGRYRLTSSFGPRVASMRPGEGWTGRPDATNVACPQLRTARRATA